MSTALLHADDGTSIIELGVSMFVTALMAAAAVAWLNTAGVAGSLHEADDRAGQELRVAKELVGRDLRNAEAVLSASTGSVSIWLDDDDDDFQDPGEVITWTITSTGEFTRRTDTAEPVAHASNLVVGSSAFAYDAPLAADVTRIAVRLVTNVVDVDGNRGTRSLGVEVQVRNS